MKRKNIKEKELNSLEKEITFFFFLEGMEKDFL